MNKIRTLLVAFLTAVFLTLSGVSPAAASDYLCPTQSGGRVYNEYDSTRSIAIYSQGCGKYYYGSVPPRSWSNYWANFRDTDAFYVGRLFYCKNTATGYKYFGHDEGRWYKLENDSVAIRLFCASVLL